MDNSDIRILVVDDDPDILFATVRIIKKEGFEVIRAETGNQCMEEIEKNHPDLILLDVELPDIQGTEVCEKLKNNPDHQKTNIMMLSGRKTSSEDLADGLDCGADGYAGKFISKTCFSTVGNPLSPFCLTRQPQTKKLFSIYINRACPTNGSDCGSFLTQSNLIR